MSQDHTKNMTAAEKASYSSLMAAHTSGSASAGPALSALLNIVGNRLVATQTAAFLAGTLTTAGIDQDGA